jgi:very-short-patch-repair endonuclease
MSGQQVFAPESGEREQYQRLCQALTADEARNQLICDDVVQAARQGRCPLLLTERTEHLRQLADRLSGTLSNVVVLCGGMRRPELKAAMERLQRGSQEQGPVVLATGKYIGEGFDEPRLDTLFLAMPVSWRGTVAQYAGRLHRLSDSKREVRVYDYADLDVPVFSRMFDRRCRGYEAIGYTILLPASALPGWPAEVPLPVEPAWKRDYAASVRRLVLDGVDVPLANLFVCATQPPAADAKGIDRARSASEAFLFRRVESLPATKGRFQLNLRLPIAFEGGAHMEVDFLCTEARVAIELDGAQHFADAEAYRRDRRKDALLQEHGYFVLRFLTEDVGQHLDHVLNTILRTLEHQKRVLAQS